MAGLFKPQVPKPAAPTTPSYADFERDYWAPDRDAVLAQMKGGDSPAPSAAPPASPLPPSPPPQTYATPGAPLTNTAPVQGKSLFGFAPQGPPPASSVSAMGQMAQAANTPPPVGDPSAVSHPAMPGAPPGVTPSQGTGNIQNDWNAFIASQQNPTQAGGYLKGLIPQFNQQYGYNAQATGDDTVNFGQPGLDSVDVLTSGNQWWWNPEANGGMGGNQAGAGAQSGDPQIDGALREALLKLLSDSQQTPNIGDSTLSPQSATYRNSRQAQADQTRSVIAERMAAEGLNSGGAGSGAFDTAVQGNQEQAGQDIAANDAGLVGQEVEQRRQALIQGLNIANAVGARKEANALQMALANLDNQYRYSALGQQQGQFEDTQSFNWANLQAELNRQALLNGMNG